MNDPFQGPGDSPRSGAPQPSWLPPGWTPTPPQLGPQPDPRQQPQGPWYPQPGPLSPVSVGWSPPPPPPPVRYGLARILGLAVALVLVFAVGFAAGGLPATNSPAATPFRTLAPLVTQVPTEPGATQSGGTQPAETQPGDTPQPEPTGAGPGATVPPNVPTDFGVFWEALKLVQDNFVDASKVTDQNLTWGAIRGMVDALGDTGHSDFLTPDDLKADNDSLNGHVSGIGVVVDSRNVPPTIVTVIPNSPAAGAGLRPGDMILAVDGTSTETLQPSEIVTRIRGQAGTSVTLSIQHAGDSSPVDVSIVRADVSVPASTWGMVPGTQIADIHVQQFSSGAAKAAQDNIQAALAAGAQKIVLDLRGNPGGYVNEAITLASQFLPEGATVYQEKDRAGNIVLNKAEPGGLAVSLPLVVLVDQGSASAAEIVAGSMQGNKRAQLVGEKTFGTGTVLDTYMLSDGSAIRLGVREWLTPTGDTIFGKGITPDVVVALPTDGTALDAAQLVPMSAADFAASKDTQLQKAVALLTGP